MKITKIVSGGQTGVDQGALQAEAHGSQCRGLGRHLGHDQRQAGVLTDDEYNQEKQRILAY